MKKKEGNNLASIYEEKYGIGKNGDTGKQWNASLQRMFVDDVEEQGLAPKSLGIALVANQIMAKQIKVNI